MTNHLFIRCRNMLAKTKDVSDMICDKQSDRFKISAIFFCVLFGK